jgi:hypothetical protein
MATADGTPPSLPETGTPAAGETPAGPASPPSSPVATVPTTDSETGPKVYSEEYVRQLMGETAQRRRELTALQAKLKAYEDAQLTETERTAQRLKELEPKAERTDRLEAALKAAVAAQTKGLPEHITAVLSKLTPEDQLDYLSEHGAALRPTATASPTNPARGTNGAPFDLRNPPTLADVFARAGT